MSFDKTMGDLGADAPKAEDARPSDSEPAIESSPEFKAAVDRAVKAASVAIKDQILAQLSKVRDGEAVDEGSEEMNWVKALAMEFAQISDQGTGRKRVAPEILRQREEAHALCLRLIVEAHAAKEQPVYRLTHKVYLNEQLIDPIWIDPLHRQQGVEIGFFGIPNEAMVPVNEVGKRIHKAYMDSIGSVPKPEGERALAGVTAKGHVILSGSKAVQPPVALGDQQVDDDGLQVLHRGKGAQYVEKRILGTQAPPVRQTI